jgi:hypothetical protein
MTSLLENVASPGSKGRLVSLICASYLLKDYFKYLLCSPDFVGNCLEDGEVLGMPTQLPVESHPLRGNIVL